MGETSDYNFGYSGKELDQELDTEEGLSEISSEDLASDFRGPINKLYAKVPDEFKEEFENILTNIEFYYDLKKEDDWQEDVFEPLDELLQRMELATKGEIEEDDEFGLDLAEIRRASDKLKKSKVN